MGWKLKEIVEDHDGAGLGVGGKLSMNYDVTWHDLTVTPDFLQKMKPFQKVNHFPGMYIVCHKNQLARNLMKMQ